MSTQKTPKAKKANQRERKKTPDKTNEIGKRPLIEGEFKLVPISEIDASPFNYRNHFPEMELKELAADVAQHGIISNLTVRLLSSGRYQLVVGERRLRAAALAGLKEVPASVVSLSDQQAMEIQLSENLQRSDPHPMQEALAIDRLQKQPSTIEEIAARIGKSKAFVYNRLKLLSLIEPFREIFLAGKCSAQQAFEIASISAESQSEFYQKNCVDWQTDEDFEMPDTKHALNQFKYDLTRAPFDVKDKKLVPEAGACSGCPFNTATIKTLFPELAAEAFCTKMECFEKKCRAHHALKLNEIFNAEKPDALLYSWEMPAMLGLAVKVVPGADVLPKYDRRSISIYSPLQMPDKEDFILEYNDDEDDESSFDEQAYCGAMEEFNTELKRYGSGLLSEVLKGLHFSDTSCHVIFFIPRSTEIAEHQPNVTAREVHLAIKAGSATPELLKEEINRINDREQRSKELDREKVQLKVHEKFEDEIARLNFEPSLADLVAVRLILLQSLGYSAKVKILEMLFGDSENPGFRNGEDLYRLLENLTRVQFASLIHIAIASNADSKFPKTETGYFLYQMAEQAGLNLADIEQEQKEKADKRQERQQERIFGLQKQIKKMQPKE